MERQTHTQLTQTSIAPLSRRPSSIRASNANPEPATELHPCWTTPTVAGKTPRIETGKIPSVTPLVAGKIPSPLAKDTREAPVVIRENKQETQRVSTKYRPQQRQLTLFQCTPAAASQLTPCATPTPSFPTQMTQESNQEHVLQDDPDGFVKIPLTEPELALLQTLKSRWDQRSGSLKQISTAAWQNTQRRFLPLLVLSTSEREEEFEARRDAGGWSYRTCAGYWSAMVKAAEQVGVQVTPEMRVCGRLYSFLGKEEDEKRKTKPLLRGQLSHLQPLLCPLTFLLVETAFELGQRIGDTAKLQADHITWLQDGATGLKLLAIQYRKGKTTRRRDPFTLHLAASMPLAADLWNTAQSRRGQLLFCDPDNVCAMMTEMRNALKNIDAELSLLSIRRGGLQDMALAGMSESSLLHHSRHTTLQLLHRYLEWGTLMLDHARERYLGHDWRDKFLKEQNGPPSSSRCLPTQ